MTHEERIEIIMRPFFITRFGPSYLWSGTIIGDNFPVVPDEETIYSGAAETLPNILPSQYVATVGRTRRRGTEHLRPEEEAA